MNVSFIYLVENISGNLYEVYVDKSDLPRRRELEHKRKFGKHISFTIIDEINSIRRRDWERLKQMWVNSFLSWGFLLPHNTHLTCNVNKHNNKSVLQYDLNGKFIKRHPSVKQATKELNLSVNDIRYVITGKKKHADRYYYVIS